MFKLKKERINFKKKIGSGASGNVYPYQKDADDSKWVVKRIHADDTDQLLSFLPEIVLGFSCDHPCIVPLKGYSIEKIDQDDYYIYLKLPRMKETLKEKFDEQKRGNKTFSEEELVKYFYSMVCAVDYLHKKKIYHRDIKPGNVLLDASGNVMLSDVGVAKHVGDEEIYQPLTGQGGTVDYTAPELLKDKSKLTKENLIAGDAWSLGLVMLELCALKNRLFNPYAAQEKIEEVQKSSCDQLKEVYSKILVELIMNLLKVEPNERIKIAALKQTLEAEFQHYLDSELKCGGEERIHNDENQQKSDLLESDKKPDQNATKEMVELVESLLRENSQLQNQVNEQKSFLNGFYLEMITELGKPEDEAIKRLLSNLYDTVQKLHAYDGIQDLQKDKEDQPEPFLIPRRDEENLQERNENSSQNVEKEEKKEPQDSIPKSQSIFFGGSIDRSEETLLKIQNEAFDKLKKEGRAKIVIAGFSAGGKTSVFLRLVKNTFDPVSTITIGAQYSQLRINREEKRLLLDLWDTANAEVLRYVLGMYLKGSLVLIIVYDITDRNSFDDLESLIEFQKECTASPIILFVVGNKLDLESERKVAREEANAFAKKHEGIHFEVSAKTAENIDELRNTLEEAILEKYNSILSVNSRSLSDLAKEKKKPASFWNFFR